MSVKRKDLITHIEGHVKYPATKKQLVEACNMMSDVSKADKDWFSRSLPDRTYKNSDEVKKALKL